MASNVNPMQFIQMVKGCGNLQNFVMNVLQQQSQNNPIATNLFNLAKNNQTAEIEQVARNLCKEQGKDFDKEFNDFKRMFGL
jgi:3-methyladenine DNA glycosylase Tag